MKIENRFIALFLVVCCLGLAATACSTQSVGGPENTKSLNILTPGASTATEARETADEATPTAGDSLAPQGTALPTATASPASTAVKTAGATATPVPTPTEVTTAQWTATELTFYSSGDTVVASDDMEQSSSDWKVFDKGTLSYSSETVHSGKRALCFSDRQNSWSSPMMDLYAVMKANGAGTYHIHFWLYVQGAAGQSTSANVLIRGSVADANSFIVQSGGNYYGTLESGINIQLNTWTQINASVTVLAEDLARNDGDFNLMLGSLETADGQTLYIDDFSLVKSSYASPFMDVSMDVLFTGPGGTTIKMPAFWDGGNIWRVRFAPTKTGEWTFKTICSDTSNKGLHNKTGTVNATAYTGSLDIYRHGFVTTKTNTRYFVYADGTPFFYLGDTHWILPHEKFDTSNVQGIASQFKYVVDKRVNQGFTVYQSEPIQTSHGGKDEAVYDLSDGLSETDLAGFENLDRKFKYIADAGLVHANSQLFFASEFTSKAEKYSDAYLEKLCRYWVARYAAYPVLWTTAQEIDKRGPELWEKVMTYVAKYDPYKHPATAHQENASVVTASNSIYRDMKEHTWYAPQWKDYVRDTKKMYSFSVPKDYWENGQGKPVVNYEGCYEGFYTDRMGARAQGWLAFLNGMYGHGYGAAGIWNDIYALNDYGTGYLITGDNPGVNFDKYYKTWDQGINMKGADDLGLMKKFLESVGWWELTPRFDDGSWSDLSSSWYALASRSNVTYVAYFYNSTTLTGTLKGMASSSYTARWFDPETGAYRSIGTITPVSGQWTVPAKPDTGDWVLLVQKN